MRASRILLALCLVAAGCTDASVAAREDENVSSSFQFDGVPCDQLLAQRNDLAQRNGLPQDATPSFTSSPTGLGPFLPDVRSAGQREKDKASGEIDAMNRSMIRRQCAKVAKTT